MLHDARGPRRNKVAHMSRKSHPFDQRRAARSDAGGTQPDTTVTDLLTAVTTGDERAFAALYHAVSPRVYGLARRITRNHALAEEVAQDVLVEVWRKAPRFDAQRGSGIGWILMMTHRRAVDRIRRTSASRGREAREAAIHPVQEPIDERIVRDDEHREVTAALGALTDLQRQAIRLAYYEGHTYREVARLLAVPEGTAKSRLRDGIVQLRATLRRNA